MQHQTGQRRLVSAKTALTAVLATVLLAGCGTTTQPKSKPTTALAVTTSTMKGINHAHAWFTGKTDQALTDMKSWGANTARIVLATGCRWTKTPASEVSSIISKAKSLGYTSLVLEAHDTTGYGEQSGACTLADATSYWNSIKSTLVGQENFVIINIGNEPYGNNNTANWITDTKTAIQTMRNNGFTHTLMVDAPNWGQDWSFTMRDNAQSVRDADTRKDVIFSIHMYGVFDTAAEIQSYMKAFSDKGLPLIVGEFASTHSDGNPDEASILQYAKQYNIGLLGWSWSGNSSDLSALDMATNWSATSPSTWGSWFKANVLGGSSSTPTATASVSLSVSSTSISSGQSVNLTATPTVSNTTVSSVEFLSGSTVISTDTSSPYTASVSPSTTTSYTARVNTAANVSATSAAVSVSVSSGSTSDTTAPTVSLATSSSSVTTAGSITLTATASDNVGVSKVEFYSGSTLLASDTSSPYTNGVSISSSDNGTKSFTAKAYDAAGNATTSSAVSVSVNIASSGGGSSSGCSATIASSNDWGNGGQYNVTVKNNGTSAISGWKLSWTEPTGVTITGSWNATVTGTTGAITATNVSWNGSLGAGASSSFGFQVTFASGASKTIPTVTCQ